MRRDDPPPAASAASRQGSPGDITHLVPRNTQVARGKIKDSVRNAIWAKTAGRCTLCNRRVLNDDRTFWHSAAAAEMAHIRGATATPGSPRGLDGGDGAEGAIADLEAEENLLLCCHDCHRIIDNPDHVGYCTADKLRALKAAHELRVEMATSDGILTRTAVMRVASQVRGSRAVGSRREVAETLFADDYLGLVESHWSGQFTCELTGEATDPGYWAHASTQVERTLRTVAQAVEQGDVGHVSVFAIAPIPVLVYLGSRLDDKVETRLWQKHRDAGWCWPNDTEPVRFDLTHELAGGDPAATDVVLVCSLSAEVDPARMPEDLREAPRFVLRPDGRAPSPTLMRNEKTLANFGVRFRDLLAEAERAYPSAQRWHLVAAVPVSAAIEAGRAFMRDVQPFVHVYQRTPAQVYEDVLRVNGPAPDPLGPVPAQSDRAAGGRR